MDIRGRCKSYAQETFEQQKPIKLNSNLETLGPLLDGDAIASDDSTKVVLIPQWPTEFAAIS